MGSRYDKTGYRNPCNEKLGCAAFLDQKVRTPRDSRECVHLPDDELVFRVPL